jgi:hypothetical protein
MGATDESTKPGSEWPVTASAPGSIREISVHPGQAVFLSNSPRIKAYTAEQEADG